MAEANGAVGDLGVLLPYGLGAVLAGVLTPLGVFAGFGLAYIATGLIYRLPIAVQPMKAIGAVALADGLTAPEIMISGVAIGLVLLALGASGLIRRMARLIPQTVTSGLQLGLGLMLALFALSLMAEGWWIGAAGLVALLGLGLIGPVPAALLVVAGSAAIAWLTLGMPHPAIVQISMAGWLPAWNSLGWTDIPAALGSAVLPQLPLTLTNAVIVAAALARELFPERGSKVTETRLALSSGALNLLLAPFGAMPMCHGAGGLAAHHRFGARSGLAPVLLGIALLGIAALPVQTAIAVLALVPIPVLGALLLVSAKELAVTPRLWDATPSCKMVIALTALVTLAANPAIGLAAGWAGEVVRRYAVRRLFSHQGRAAEAP